VNSVYLNDFLVYKGEGDSYSFSEVLSLDPPIFPSPSANSFLDKTYRISGIGEEAPLLKLVIDKIRRNPKPTLEDAREEVSYIAFQIIESILKKNNLLATDIDLLVTCSSFSPIPTVSSLVVNHFKMKEDVITYNIGSMGCSSSLIGMEIAQNYLKLNSDKKALILNVDSTCDLWYSGNDFHLLLADVLFKTGGVVALLSDSKCNAQFKFEHDIVRSHFGASDTAYKSIYQRNDNQGIAGVGINFNLTNIASPFIKKHCEKVGGRTWQAIAIHTGGLSIIQEISKALSLTEEQSAFSLQSFQKYGNMSGASVWYTFDLIREGFLGQDEVIWLLSFGSGFKVCSLFLRRI